MSRLMTQDTLEKLNRMLDTIEVSTTTSAFMRACEYAGHEHHHDILGKIHQLGLRRKSAANQTEQKRPD